MRVNVQLIDAETGDHLWAERFDKPVADLFDMQDEIVARLARQLDAELIAAEARRADERPIPTRWTCIFRAWPAGNKGQTQEILRRRGAFSSAPWRVDPGSVDALIGAAWTDAMRGIFF